MKKMRVNTCTLQISSLILIIFLTAATTTYPLILDPISHYGTFFKISFFFSNIFLNNFKVKISVIFFQLNNTTTIAILIFRIGMCALSRQVSIWCHFFQLDHFRHVHLRHSSKRNMGGHNDLKTNSTEAHQNKNEYSFLCHSDLGQTYGRPKRIQLI